MALQNNSTKPVAITMGDPAGVGPEVIMAALSALSPDQRQGIVVVGSRAVLERAGKVVGSSLTVGLRSQAGNHGVVVEEVDVPGLVAEFGKLDASCGEAAFRYIERAVRLTEAGEMAGLVTAPIGAPHTFRNADADAPATLLCTVTPERYIGYLKELAALTQTDAAGSKGA